jgi:uncharacterized protein DUF6445
VFDRARLCVNERRVASTVRIGPDPHHEILVIDDFYVDPSYVRALALGLEYQDRGRLPWRADIGLEISSIVGAVRDLVDPSLEVIPDYRCFVFSTMDERAPAKVRHFPHPHVDSVGKGSASLSCLIYLNPPEQCRGGTAFYCHRETELRETRGELTPALASYMMKHQLVSIEEAYAKMSYVSPEDKARLAAATDDWGYITDSNDEWELTSLVEMTFNRCIVFDSMFFHNPYLRCGDFGTTAETRRLTQTMFFEMPAS